MPTLAMAQSTVCNCTYATLGAATKGEQNVNDIKVYYKTEDQINDKFEKALDRLMHTFGLERWASGFDLCEQVRDIAYDKPSERGQE